LFNRFLGYAFGSARNDGCVAFGSARNDGCVAFGSARNDPAPNYGRCPVIGDLRFASYAFVGVLDSCSPIEARTSFTGMTSWCRRADDG